MARGVRPRRHPALQEQSEALCRARRALRRRQRWWWHTSAGRSSGWRPRSSSRARTSGWTRPWRRSTAPSDLFEFIVKKHGADRTLFASDSPWSDTAEAAEMIRGPATSPTRKRRASCTAPPRNSSGASARVLADGRVCPNMSIALLNSRVRDVHSIHV